jgi:hypothetical protein
VFISVQVRGLTKIKKFAIIYPIQGKEVNYMSENIECSSIRVKHLSTKLVGETINPTDERMKIPGEKISLSPGKVLVLFRDINTPVMVPTKHLQIIN